MGYLGTKPANQISSDTLADGAVTTQKLAISAISYVAPTGVVLPFGGPSAPTGWLLCNGSAVSRSTYSALFSALGTTYGSGDGSTTFNLPDLQNKIPVGVGGGKTLGGTGGATTQTPTIGNTTLSASQIPSHTHTSHIYEGGGGYPGGSGNLFYSRRGDLTYQPITTDGGTGGGGAHNHSSSAISVEQPYVALNYIIKV